MPAPYRDENDTLRAENARLRAKLSKRSGASRSATAALLVLLFGAIVFLRPWLNGESDGKFWGAVAILAGIAGVAILSVVFGRRV